MDESRLQELVGRVVGDTGAAFGAATVVLGDRLGLWRALAGAGAMTSADLAKATGTNERLVAEWLAAQAAAGEDAMLDVAREAAFSRTRLATSTPFNLVLELRP